MQLCHACQIVATTCRFQLYFELLDGFLDGGSALLRSLFSLPHFIQVGVFLLESLQGFFKRCQTLARGVVIFFAQRHLFDAQLDDASL